MGGIFEVMSRDETMDYLKFNILNYKNLVNGLDWTPAINQALTDIRNNGNGRIVLPVTNVYQISEPIVLDQEYMGIEGDHGLAHILNQHNGDTIQVIPASNTVTAMFATVKNLRLEGNVNSGHGINLQKLYNAELEMLYIHNHKGDGLYGLNAMMSKATKVRSDLNNNGFNLEAIDTGNRSTTFDLDRCYFGQNNNLGGLLNGGDSNTLTKCVFEGTKGTGLYITNGEVNPNLYGCYFESNSGYSLNIDAGGSGNIFGGRFADEGVTAHIQLGNTTAWNIFGTWHSTNSASGGSGVNINKTYTGGVDNIYGGTRQGATPIGGNTANVKIIA